MEYSNKDFVSLFFSIAIYFSIYLSIYPKSLSDQNKFKQQNLFILVKEQELPKNSFSYTRAHSYLYMI